MHECYTGADQAFIRQWTYPCDDDDINHAYQHDLLPDVAQMAVQLTPRGQLAQARFLHLYTVGTGGEARTNDSAAAFGAIVLAEVANNTQFLTGVISDQVESSGSFITDIGYATDNAAEIAGLAYAVAIALSTPPHIDITITIDSQLTIDLALGLCIGATTAQAQNIVRPLRKALTATRSARSCHIPSYIGHPWNEMADGVAHSASLGTASGIKAACVALSEPSAALSWMWLKRSADAKAYPHLGNDGFFVLLPSILSQPKMISSVNLMIPLLPLMTRLLLVSSLFSPMCLRLRRRSPPSRKRLRVDIFNRRSSWS